MYDKNGNRLNNDNNYLEIEQFLVDKFNSEEDFTPIHKKIIPKIDNNINLLIKILTDNICFISEMEQYEIEIIKPDKKCSDFKTNLECNDYLIVDLIQCLWIENICKEIIVDENCQILNGLCSFKVTPINGKLCSLNEGKTECLLLNIQNNDKSDEKENNEDKENENNNKDDKNDLSDKNINLNESYVNDERDKTDNNQKNNCNKIFLDYQLFILFFLFLV